MQGYEGGVASKVVNYINKSIDQKRYIHEQMEYISILPKPWPGINYLEKGHFDV